MKICKKLTALILILSFALTALMPVHTVFAAETKVITSARTLWGDEYYRYHQLTADQQYLYSSIWRYTVQDYIDENNQVKVNLKIMKYLNITNEDLWETMFAFIDDFSFREYWISQNRVSGTVTQDKANNCTYVSYTFNAIGSKEEIADITAKMNKIISDVKAQTDKYSKTKDKVRYIHDYICNKADYASTELSNRYAKENRIAWTAAGALVKGRATCAGYAGAFNLLCYNAGVTSASQGCTSVYGDSHGFNVVKMDDGKWYAVDCTWDGSGTETKNTYYLIGKQTVDKFYKDLYKNGITINPTDYSG